jgi:hypothetical protein
VCVLRVCVGGAESGDVDPILGLQPCSRAPSALKRTMSRAGGVAQMVECLPS